MYRINTGLDNDSSVIMDSIRNQNKSVHEKNNIQ